MILFLPPASGAAVPHVSNVLIGDGAGGISDGSISVTEVATKANDLSQFAYTTSAQLLGIIQDPTGTGALVFDTNPTFSQISFAGSGTFLKFLAASDIGVSAGETCCFGRFNAYGITATVYDSEFKSIAIGGGVAITKVLSGTVADAGATLGTLAAGAYGTIPFTVTGVVAGDKVEWSSSGTFAKDGIVFADVYTGTDTVGLIFLNTNLLGTASGNAVAINLIVTKT